MIARTAAPPQITYSTAKKYSYEFSCSSSNNLVRSLHTYAFIGLLDEPAHQHTELNGTAQSSRPKSQLKNRLSLLLVP